VNLITIDPGVHGTGIAIFGEGVGGLVAATYIRPDKLRCANLFEEAHSMAGRAVEWFESKIVNCGPFAGGVPDLIIEIPKHYPFEREVDPNDLINLAAAGYAVAGALMRFCADSERVFPRDWKGTMDGDAMTERISKRLRPDETERLDVNVPSSLRHNMFDAIGIGLWSIGRLKPVRVFPGATNA
jgi:hypothetical protein